MAPAEHRPSCDVIVVGAGLAGLVAARDLRETGRSVLVVEGAPEVGGRLATRRLGGAVADVGAQFFTVRSRDFDAFVEPLVGGGVVREWCRGFETVDGYPRYAVRGGMAHLAAHLAEGLEVLTDRPATAVRRDRRGWRVALAGGQRDGHEADGVAARAVLLTPPVPASLALLDVAGTRLDPAVEAGLRELRYHAVLAVVATLDRPSAVPPPGARQLSEGPFSFVADNAAKGLSAVPALTLHAAHQVSASRWSLDDDTVLAQLLEEAAPWVGRAQIEAAELYRWPCSGPVVPWPDRCCQPAPGVVLAGDAFGGPKVEGAFLSGRAAARALAAFLDDA